MSRTISVYSPPWSCVQCNATYRWLDSRGIEYTVADSTDLDNNAAIKALGHSQAPVVIVSNGDAETDLDWSGFQPAMLAKYCTEEP